jgi:hypothetical protein
MQDSIATQANIWSEEKYVFVSINEITVSELFVPFNIHCHNSIVVVTSPMN